MMLSSDSDTIPTNDHSPIDPPTDITVTDPEPAWKPGIADSAGSAGDGFFSDATDNDLKEAWGVIREILETVALAVAIWLVVNFATARYIVIGNSMQPNLETGEFLLVSRLSYRLGEPERGDIIIFDYPGNLSDDYVKRVIGLPGDAVSIDGNRVIVNGVQLDEPYIDGPTSGAGLWQVPEGHYFVLGDNRGGSSDSRSWGMLDEEHIIGKAVFSYWPVNRLGLIPHYDYDNLEE